MPSKFLACRASPLVKGCGPAPIHPSTTGWCGSSTSNNDIPRLLIRSWKHDNDDRSNWKNTVGIDWWSIGAVFHCLCHNTLPWLPPPLFPVPLHLGINPNNTVICSLRAASPPLQMFKATCVTQWGVYNERIIQMANCDKFISASTTETLWLFHGVIASCIPPSFSLMFSV